jgi:hypothetical protein
MIATLALLGGPALAQQVTTGSIDGTVVDPQGALLPGATVTLSSPEGPKPTTADASGHFRFPYLTPGAYGLTATLQGFNNAESPSIEVTLGSHVRVEVQLTPRVSEKMDVVAAAPVVDLTQTTTGATIPTSLMNSVPIGRTFASALALAPGVVASGLDNSNPSINGASGLENTYMVDGVNIGNTGFGSAGSYSGAAGTGVAYFTGYGSLGTGVNFDYIQEVQVKTGGYEPEFGEALGGFVNLVTKSGTNEYKGSIFTYYQPNALEAERVRSDRLNATSDPTGYQSTDVGFEVGGPLVRDKAFWFAAFDPTFTTRKRETSKAFSEALNFDHKLDVNRDVYNYATNLKWLVSPGHTLDFSAFGDPGRGDKRAQREDALAVPVASTKFSDLKWGSHNAIARWNGTLRDNWFIESSIAYHQDKFEETPDPAYDLPFGLDRRNQGTVYYGGLGGHTRSKSRNTQYVAKLTNYLHGAGEHSIRYGTQFEDIGYDNTSLATGPSGIRLPDGNLTSTGFAWSIEPDSLFHFASFAGSRTAKTKAHYLAFFASDSWNPTTYLNIMAGLRYEEEKLIGTKTTFRWKDNWAPRLHVTLDPTRDNKSKLSFAFGRFFGKVPNDLAVRSMSTDINYGVVYPLSSVDLSDPNNPRITNPDAYSYYYSFGSSPTHIDPKSKLTYQDEYVVSAEREIAPSFSLGLSYMHRSLGRTLEDTQVTSMSSIIDTSAAGHQNFGDYIITNPTPSQGFPTPTRKYNAVTLQAEKQLRDNWQLLGSYTWSRLEGTYEGYYRRDNGQSDPFITDLYDFPQLKDPDVFKFGIEDGLLPNDRTHVFNLFGAHSFGAGVNLGMSFKVQSGIPLTKLGYNPVYGYGNYYPLEKRGASGRGPTTTDVGLHADYKLALGHSGRKLNLIVNVFNLLNQQKGVDFVHDYEVGGVIDPPARWQANGIAPCPACVNPDFGKPSTFQLPRQIQLAARSSF